MQKQLTPGKRQGHTAGSLQPQGLLGMILGASTESPLWTFPHILDIASAYLDTWKDVLLTRKKKKSCLEI